MRTALAAFTLAVVTCIPHVAAQCATTWAPANGLPGTDGHVNAMTLWDPDGAGPATPVVVVVGKFGIAGTVRSDGVATYDPQTGAWTALPGLMPGGEAFAVTVAANNDVIVGGAFGLGVNSVLRRTGSAWVPLAGGFNGNITSLAAMPNGDLFVSGSFTTVGGAPIARLAQWNGTSWLPLTVGFANGSTVSALLALPNGDLVVGGNIAFAGASPYSSVVRWNGATWTVLPGLTGATETLLLLPNGDIVAGGYQLLNGRGVARWDGINWNRFGHGVTGAVHALARSANGDLIAAGELYTLALNNIARWDGAAWLPLANGVQGFVRALAIGANGDLVASGDFSFANGVAVNRMAVWNGTAWRAPTAGLPGGETAMLLPPNGNLVTASANITKGYVRQAIPGGWATLGVFDGDVNALAARPNGNLIAAGRFATVGGTTVNGVAEWDGNTWFALGGGLTGSSSPHATAVGVRANGDVVVGGEFVPLSGPVTRFCVRWDGQAWTNLGNTPAGLPGAFLELANGDLVVGTSSAVQRLVGNTWTTIGWPFTGGVRTLTVFQEQIVAAGDFTVAGGVAANHIARWNGTIWLPFGTGVTHTVSTVWIAAMRALPSGDLAVAGRFSAAGGVAADNIARWDGSSWSSFGTGVASLAATPGTTVNALALAPDDSLAVAGTFTLAGGVPASNFAQLETSCPAAVVVAGASCTGSGGNNLLVAQSRPWVGSTFRSVATGMPANGLALAVFGTATSSIPLSTLLPQGTVGCTLFVQPAVLEAHVPVAGSVALALALPDATALIGQQLYQQVVPVELGAGGGIVAVTASNALLLTLGWF